MVITSITGDAAEPFAGLLPAAELERVLDSRAYGLGAVDDSGETPCAAGVLVFSVEAGSDGEKDVVAAVLRWLYVAESQRRRGAAEALMQELFRIADGSGVEHILCDVPMPAEYNELCAYLESWGFDFQLTDVFEAQATLGALRQNRAISEGDGSGAFPLAEVSEKAFSAFLSRLRKLPDTPTDIDGRYAFYDPVLSRTTLSGGALTGLLLIHVDAQGALEIVLLRSLASSPHAVGSMVASAVRAAAELPDETPLRYLCRTDADRNVTARLFPELAPLLVRRGYLFNGPEQTQEVSS